MLLATHTAAAIYISTQVDNPMLAFIWGVVSHFILDFIPHGDDGVGQHITNESARFRYFIKTASLDAFISLGLIFVYLESKVQVNSASLSGAVMGAWLPDVLWASVYVFKIKWLNWYCRFHTMIHDALGVKISFKTGLIIQLAFIVLLFKISL